jgi:predicted aspartyl protease
MSPLADYLARFDYVAVPLVRAATGHLFIDGAAINGRDVTLCLDTGAGRTVVDVARARELGLPLEADSRRAGGAGSAAMENYRTRLASLDLQTVTEDDYPVHAIDLSHVNTALVAGGGRPMDGVIGADLLDAREAVIDYRHLRLFLKRTARPRTAAA